MNYSAITYPDVNNGLGCRVTLWVSGCQHHCEGCHNPETWNMSFGKEFTKESEKQLFNLLALNYIKGITLSGGDPLFYPNCSKILELVNTIRSIFPKKDIWVYTGYLFEDIIATYKSGEIIHKDQYNILKNIDVLVDGRYEESLRDTSLAFKGSSNQRIIDVKRSLKESKVITLDL